MEYLLIFLICRPQLVYCMCFTAMEHSCSYRELNPGCYRFSWWPIWSSVLSKPRPEKRVGQHSLFAKFTQPCMLLTPIAHLRLLRLLYSSMSLLLLVFPSLPLIVSSEYFIYPFIVSKIPYFFFISTISQTLIQVSRLILNLLEANCPLDTSTSSKTIETLKFFHSESKSDTEANISQDNQGGTSIGEEIYEEERWWLGHLVLFFPVHMSYVDEYSSLFCPILSWSGAQNFYSGPVPTCFLRIYCLPVRGFVLMARPSMCLHAAYIQTRGHPDDTVYLNQLHSLVSCNDPSLQNHLNALEDLQQQPCFDNPNRIPNVYINGLPLRFPEVGL